MPFWVALLALGVVVSISVVPGAYTVDDNNYLINVLALRQGHVTIANTAGLAPSRELLFFDPGPQHRAVNSTPVASTAPPLYALLALPFSWLGWRGLVAVNTLAYLATIVIVFLYGQRYSTEAATAWLAAGAFALGGCMIDYALGVWPHALSILLCTAAIVAAGRAIDGGGVSLAAAAGFLLALATGVRYQNAVVLGSVGGALALWASPRLKTVASFVVAAAVPLSASAAINHARLDSWNPISKGPGYLGIPVLQDARSSVLDPLVMFWARLVDFSTQPQLHGPDVEGWLRYDAATGAHLMLGITLKKALLQSAPWAVLAFLLFVLAWAPTFRIPGAQRRQLRLLSLVTFAILLTFAFSGVTRHDGMSFNMRYLLEVLPLAAVAFAWALEQRGLRAATLGTGAGLGAGLVLLIVLGTPMVGGPEVRLWTVRQLAILRIPLVLAAVLTILWLLDRAGYGSRFLLSLTVGACLAWGFTLHLSTDVLTAQALRRENRIRSEALKRVVPDGSALVAYRGNSNAAVSLLFDRDVVILDARADEGADAPSLIRALLARDRRVFVLENGFPAEVLERIMGGFERSPVRDGELRLLELRTSAQSERPPGSSFRAARRAWPG